MDAARTDAWLLRRALTMLSHVRAIAYTGMNLNVGALSSGLIPHLVMKGPLVVELAGDIVEIEMDALSNRSCTGQPRVHATKQYKTSA